MAVRIPKNKPDWLTKIHSDHVKQKNKEFESWLMFVKAKIKLDETIECINAKYKTDFSIDQLFQISSKDEEQAIDMLGLDSDSDDDDDNTE